MPIRCLLALFCLTATAVFADEPPKSWQENTITLLSRIAKPLEVANADAAAEADMKPYTEIITGTDVTFDMLPIPGGKFKMGSTAEEQAAFAADPDVSPEFFDNASEGPQHDVQISAFWMGKCEVTWEEFDLWAHKLEQRKRKDAPNFLETEREKITDAISMPSMVAYTDLTFDMGKTRRPAIAISLYATQFYCKWLSVKTGRYYRLPTEAEWEYACRAGTDTAFSFGDDATQFGEYGWCYDNSDDKYQPVGQKKPNPWDLYDMHGNVREWCLDQYFVDGYQKQIDAANGKTLVNPFMPFAKYQRYPGVARGGSWYDEVENCRSAARFSSHKSWNGDDMAFPPSIGFEISEMWLGFRVVRPFRIPSTEEAAPFEPDPDVVIKYLNADPRKDGK